MKTKPKVMIFIARPKESDYEWLARRNAPHSEHGGDRWYVVTGNVEAGETIVNAVSREVEEETGINSHTRIIKLPIVNTFTVQKEPDTLVQEQAFILLTNYNGAIRLNEESTDYQWLIINEFVDKIWWPKDRQELKKVLTQALDEKK